MLKYLLNDGNQYLKYLVIDLRVIVLYALVHLVFLVLALEKTNEVIHSASEIRRTGTSGYGDKFDNLLKKIDDVNTTLINADENKKLLDVLNKEVDNLK